MPTKAHVTAHAGKKPAPKGKAIGMHIERANNGGFISHTRREMPTPKRGVPMMDYREPAPDAHADMAALHDHIDQTFGEE
ncbi:MAG TPA: hypothetical protein VFA33_07490 [Bryobacteraceae bacterium]|nr:hypothetical protein [Bryobacteraceae bacterium]